MLILWCKTEICSCKLSAKVSLMLDNPFMLPSLWKLNHISLCFIQISTKSPAKLLIPFRESNVLFFEIIPSVLGCSVNFNITQRFLLRRPVSRLSFSCDYVKTEIHQVITKPYRFRKNFPHSRETIPRKTNTKSNYMYFDILLKKPSCKC